MSSEDLYKKNIIEHYKNPRNFSKLDDFNLNASLSNVTCGDEVEIFLKVEDSIIQDVSFQGRGCAISVAATSMLTEKIKGENLDAVQKLNKKDILRMLGMQERSPREKCGVLGLEVLHKALKDS